jgi:hypothetical protein
MGIPPDFTPYDSPFWLLDAISGCRSDAEVVADESVAGVPTTRIRLTIDFEAARHCSRHPLHVPTGRANSMRAEVWIDGDGRFRRLACTLDLKLRWLPRRLVPPHWTTTEFQEFGVPVDSPALATTV